MTRPRTCKELVARLPQYLEDDLLPEERASLEAHLSGCSDCAVLLQGYADLPEMVRDATDVVMPEEARARLLARLLERARKG